MTDNRENNEDTKTDDREHRGDTGTDDRWNRGGTATDERGNRKYIMTNEREIAETADTEGKGRKKSSRAWSSFTGLEPANF